MYSSDSFVVLRVSSTCLYINHENGMTAEKTLPSTAVDLTMISCNSVRRHGDTMFEYFNCVISELLKI